MVLDLSTAMVAHGGYSEYKNLFTMTLLAFTSPFWSARYVLSASWVLPQTERCISVSIKHFNVCSSARAGSFCSLWSTIYICRAHDSPFLLISTGLLSGRSYQLYVTTEWLNHNVSLQTDFSNILECKTRGFGANTKMQYTHLNAGVL